MYSKSANKGEGGYVKVGATFDTYVYSRFWSIIEKSIIKIY